MTEQAERYDRVAEGYARWWAPVLTPAVMELLDVVAPHLEGLERLIDIGTGTGQLALEAIERWPDVSVVGIDASAEMRAMAESEAERRLSAPDRPRFRSVVAFADSLPFPDGAFDAALSSFVFQLVPNRARALREARRVLRPGGRLDYVSWLDGSDGPFLPDTIYNEVLDELGFDPPEDDHGRSGDVPSAERAVGELRRAGFSDASARAGTLTHTFTIDGYIGFLTEFDEDTMFMELDPELRATVLSMLRERLEPLHPAQLTMRFPIVFASGRRGR